MTEKLTSYDSSECLTSAQDIAFFMADAFETGDADYVAHQLRVALRSKYAVDALIKAGLSCEELSIAGTDITMKALMALMMAVGVKVTVKLPPERL